MGEEVKAHYRTARDNMRDVWSDYLPKADELWENIESSSASSQEKDSSAEQGMSTLNVRLNEELEVCNDDYVRALARVQPELITRRYLNGSQVPGDGYTSRNDPLTVQGQDVGGSRDPGRVDPNDVNQRHLGDCWLLAAIVAIVRRDPGLPDRIIKDRRDGTYEVTFHKGSRREAKVFVDASFPVSADGDDIYADRGDGELWVQILEKAYAKWRGSYRGINSGDPQDALEALTGQPARYYRTSISETRLRTKLKIAHEAGAVQVAGTLDSLPGEAKDNNGVTISPDHAYAVKSVNFNAEIIDLQNPWGSAHLTLGISKFKRFFVWIYVGKPLSSTS